MSCYFLETKFIRNVCFYVHILSLLDNNVFYFKNRSVKQNLINSEQNKREDFNQHNYFN